MRRDQKSLTSVASNNFLFIGAILLRKAGTALYVVLALILLFPMSTDPFRKVPPERLALWPLSLGERRLLRIVSPWANPTTWLLAALSVWAAQSAVTPGFWALFVILFAAGFLLPAVTGFGVVTVWRWVPPFPGPLGALIRKNLREMLSTLDVFAALAVALGGCAYRMFGRDVPGEARLALTLLVSLALSSYAQCLFGLESEGALLRYRLLPLRGWQRLAAKDAAFLLVTALLTLPLAPLPGLAAGLMVLAVGHGPSVAERRVQIRWRFTSGASFPHGLLQTALMAMAAAGVFQVGPALLILFGGVYAASTYWYGRVLERNSFD